MDFPSTEDAEVRASSEKAELLASATSIPRPPALGAVPPLLSASRAAAPRSQSECSPPRSLNSVPRSATGEESGGRNAVAPAAGSKNAAAPREQEGTPVSRAKAHRIRLASDAALRVRLLQQQQQQQQQEGPPLSSLPLLVSHFPAKRPPVSTAVPSPQLHTRAPPAAAAVPVKAAPSAAAGPSSGALQAAGVAATRPAGPTPPPPHPQGLPGASPPLLPPAGEEAAGPASTSTGGGEQDTAGQGGAELSAVLGPEPTSAAAGGAATAGSGGGAGASVGGAASAAPSRDAAASGGAAAAATVAPQATECGSQEGLGQDTTGGEERHNGHAEMESGECQASSSHAASAPVLSRGSGGGGYGSSVGSGGGAGVGGGSSTGGHSSRGARGGSGRAPPGGLSSTADTGEGATTSHTHPSSSSLSAVLEQLRALQVDQQAIRREQQQQGRTLQLLLEVLQAPGRPGEAAGQAGASLASLPDSVLRLLLARLPRTEDVARCACVCLRWRRLLGEASALFSAFSSSLAFQPLSSLSLNLEDSHLHRRLALHLALLSQHPSFSHISLSRLSLHCASPIPALLSSPSLLSSLTSLSLGSQFRIVTPTERMRHLLAATPRLQRLTLCAGNWEACFPSLPSLSSLEDLCVLVANDWVREAGEQRTLALARLTSLQSLTLKHCFPLSDLALRHIASLPRLTSLDLSDGFSRPGGADEGRGLAGVVPSLSCLQHLNVAFSACLLPGTFDALTSLPSLNSIVLGIKEYSDVAQLKLVGQMTGLTALHMQCKSVAEYTRPVQGCCWSGLWDHHRAAFTFLASLQGLRLLSLSGFCSKCIESVLLHVRYLPRLRVLALLDLQQALPADSSIHRLSGLEELQLSSKRSFSPFDRSNAMPLFEKFISLPLQSSALRVIDLKGFKIDKSSAAELSDISTLKAIRLTGCQVDNKALNELKWLPSLECIVMSGRRRVNFMKAKVVFEEVEPCNQ